MYINIKLYVFSIEKSHQIPQTRAAMATKAKPPKAFIKEALLTKVGSSSYIMWIKSSLLLVKLSNPSRSSSTSSPASSASSLAYSKILFKSF